MALSSPTLAVCEQTSVKHPTQQGWPRITTLQRTVLRGDHLPAGLPVSPHSSTAKSLHSPASQLDLKGLPARTRQFSTRSARHLASYHVYSIHGPLPTPTIPSTHLSIDQPQSQPPLSSRCRTASLHPYPPQSILNSAWPPASRIVSTAPTAQSSLHPRPLGFYNLPTSLATDHAFLPSLIVHFDSAAAPP